MLSSFFLFLLWITAENRIKLKKLFIWTINQADHNTTNLQTVPDYSSTTPLILVIFSTERDFCIISVAGIHSTTNLKTYEQAKNFLNPAKHNLHLKNTLRKNVIRLLACVPFSLGSKYWITCRWYIGVFTALLNI